MKWTMMLFAMFAMFAGLFLVGAQPSIAQQMELPKPGPELDVFKPDLGTWDVQIKAWGDDGKPVVTRGKETNRMLGGFWLLTDFEGSMLGLDFQGHGMYSYDADKKQYVGSWVDSLSASKMDMVGRHDKEANTMTYEGMAPGPDGTPAKHILDTQYKDDGTRVMTMHLVMGDQKIKIFEMTYSKAK